MSTLARIFGTHAVRSALAISGIATGAFLVYILVWTARHGRKP